MTEGIDVIVVDDDSDAGHEYARLIERATRLKVHFTSDVGEALELLRKNPIKVAVLDQRMGSEKGTALFSRMISIDARVRAVMFTGLADGSEVGEALTSGYREYLHKNEVAKLVGVVLNQYQKYQAQLASDALEKAPPLLLTRRHGFLARRKVEYVLIDWEIVTDSQVPEDAWRLSVAIEAGEEQKHTETNSSRQSLSLESESQHKLNSDLGFKPAQLETLNLALRTEITSRMKRVASDEHVQTSTKEKVYRLPPEPNDPDKLHVKARRFERAVVTQRMKVSILATCQCCGLKNVLTLNVSQETGAIATRQVDILSDGTVRVLDTGTQRE